jgi:energy-coupling factor transporter ATP-binding protein EcfA2
MTTLVYVHGTNGSGKSTLARAVLAAAGGAQGMSKLVGNPKATWTHTGTAGVVLAGKYGNACGGVDGMQPYAALHDVLKEQKAMLRSVFAEGLITPGLETCRQFAGYFDRTVFIALDTPTDVCIQNVLLRRKRAQNVKPYSPENLYAKHRTVLSWAARLEQAGLDVRKLKYSQAYALSMELLGLLSPSVDDLL